MVNKMKGRRRSRNLAGGRSVRASISFPPDVYKGLDEIARQNKVSLAWVVREASEKYIADKKPLKMDQDDAR